MLIARIHNRIGRNQILGLGRYLGLVHTKRPSLDGLVRDLACKAKGHVLLGATESTIGIRVNDESALICRWRFGGIALEKVLDEIITRSKRFFGQRIDHVDECIRWHTQKRT